jgi:DNA-binding NarL/FixJ family response regulator
LTTDDKQSIRVLLVEDHPAVREGLGLLLAREGIAVCAEAESRAQLLVVLRKAAPHLALVDLSLAAESGLDLMAEFRARRIPVLVYSMHEDGDYVRRALAAGAQGYVTKREMHRVLTQAIREVAAGRQFLGPRAAAALAADLAQSGARDADHALSDQERRAYHLLGEGGTIAEIADAMHISPRTLESYCQRIMEKLDLTGMSALRRHAIRHLQHESK